MLICPSQLSFDWGMDSVPKISSIRDSRNIWTVLFYVSLVLIVKRSVRLLYVQKLHYTKRKSIKRSAIDEKISSCHCSVCHHSTSIDLHTASCRSTNNNNTLSHVNACVCNNKKQPKMRSKSAYAYKKSHNTNATILLCMAFLTLPFLPATNLFFYVGFVIAERVLYLPSVGISLLFGLGASKLWVCKRYRVWTVLGFLFLVAVFGMRTVLRNGDWSNEEALYRSAVHINPAKGN